MDKQYNKSFDTGNINPLRCHTALILLVSGFILFYISGGVYKVLYYTTSNPFRIGQIIKGIYILLFLLHSFVFIDRVKIQYFLGISILTVFFFLGQYALSWNEPELHFRANISVFFKYLFVFFVYMPARDLMFCPKSLIKIFKTYKGIIIFNSLIILIGLLLKIEMFRTYKGPWRFGYDGLIYAQNEASYIFIFALTIVYYRRFYLHIKEWFFWITLITSMVVGTKAVLLYIILLFIFHIYQHLSIKKILYLGSTFLVTGYIIFYSLINDIVMNAINVFLYFYEKHGLWFAILSGRNIFFEKKLLPLLSEKWTIINYLFGGHDVIKYYMEMGIFDLFLFFGLIGGLLYLYLFLGILKQIDFDPKLKKFFIITLLTIVGLSGHFFESGIAGVHLIFLILISRLKKEEV